MGIFVALDFETANQRRASACAVGAVRLVDGEVAATWTTLIDPEDEFAPMNSWIHGLYPEDVRGAPTFPEMLDQLTPFLEDAEAVVAHSAAFDAQVLTASAARYSLTLPEMAVACTRVFARHWWPGWPSYALTRVLSQADLLYELDGDGHHDPLWDATAAAVIARKGLRDMKVTTWAEACEALPVRLGRIGGSYVGCVSRYSYKHAKIDPTRDPDAEVDPEHPLYGVTVCFTGALQVYTRREAAQVVVDAGGEFSAGVTRKTDLLVVGEQDLAKLNGHEQSSKMRTASELAASGQQIEVIDEADFYRMLAN